MIFCASVFLQLLFETGYSLVHGLEAFDGSFVCGVEFPDDLDEFVPDFVFHISASTVVYQTPSG